MTIDASTRMPKSIAPIEIKLAELPSKPSTEGKENRKGNGQDGERGGAQITEVI